MKKGYWTGTSITDRPAHAFEIRNVNEQIGFQWVMGGEKYQDRLARQLETFYPDSHIEIDELPQPDLLPLREDWYVAAAHLRLKLRGKKNRYYPIKQDRKSTRLNSSHSGESRMPSSA